MASSDGSELLRFSPLESCVDVSFWSSLAEAKLATLKLSEEPVPVTGWLRPSAHSGVASPVQLDGSSLGDGAAAAPRPGAHALPGKLILFNTIEAFNAADRAALLAGVVGDALLRSAEDTAAGGGEGAAASASWCALAPFLLLAFGDIKAFTFSYWFAFPAVAPSDASRSARATASATPLSRAPGPISAASQRLMSACAGVLASPGGAPHAWLLATAEGREEPSDGGPASPDAFEPRPVGDWAALRAAAAAAGGVALPVLAFSDPCALPGHPGWLLRTILSVLAESGSAPHHGTDDPPQRLSVLCVRCSGGRPDAARSLLLSIQLPPPSPPAASTPPTSDAPRFVVVPGWERDATGSLAPRFVDVSSSLSPSSRAAAAADLNLRLMAWRLFPGLDAPKLGNARALILGAGTLGCAALRSLLGWGVRTFDVVDCGRVAFSNPVRQSLYELVDCSAGARLRSAGGGNGGGGDDEVGASAGDDVDDAAALGGGGGGGGEGKAAAACAALRRILPTISATPHALRIPMPGHRTSAGAESDAALAAAAKLDALVAAADVVFLFTDTRESRWLPTLVCASQNKLVVNAALGFDSYLVMRHGSGPSSNRAADGGGGGSNDAAQQGSAAAGDAPAPPRLGCYFCQDVVAAGDSRGHRPLDEACTVTRPGCAPIAAALAVELAVAVMHHADGVAAAAGASAPPSPLGASPVPHMLRGRLADWSQAAHCGAAFSQCTACSGAVVSAYRAGGTERDALLLAAFEDSSSLERLTGLTQLHADADKGGWDDDGGDDDEG